MGSSSTNSVLGRACRICDVVMNGPCLISTDDNARDEERKGGFVTAFIRPTDKLASDPNSSVPGGAERSEMLPMLVCRLDGGAICSARGDNWAIF